MKCTILGLKTLKQLYDVVLGASMNSKFDFSFKKLKSKRIEFRLFCYMIFTNIVINRF